MKPVSEDIKRQIQKLGVAPPPSKPGIVKVTK